MQTLWAGTGTDRFNLNLAYSETTESHKISVQSTSSCTKTVYTSRTFFKTMK